MNTDRKLSRRRRDSVVAGPVRAGRLAPIAVGLMALLLALPTLGEGQLQVVVLGLSGEARDNVLASLGIQRLAQRGTGAGELSAETIREQHQQAPAEIGRALQPFGYYRPEVQSELREPRPEGTAWRASYRVHAGEPVPITGLHVSFSGPGAKDPDVVALAEGLPLRQDASLDHRRYARSKRQLLTAVQELGYLDATLVQHRVEVDLDNYSADIQLRVESGPLYRFGEIEFEQTLFDPDYLARYLVIEPGQPFNGKRVARQRTELSKSGHFSAVEVQLLPASAGPHPTIPLRIHLQPYKANRYRGRFGWGTDTGFGLQLDWTRRYLGGRGHQFNLGGGFAQERRRLAADLRYLIPLHPLAGHHIELGARHESKDLTYEDVDLEEGGETRIATNLLSASWQLPHKQLGNFAFDMAAGFSLVTESYDIFEVLFGNLPQSAQDDLIDLLGPEAYATLAPDFEALVPNLRMTLRRSDHPLFIRRGDYLDLQLLGSSEDLGSNISFWQARFSGWHIRPLFDSGRLLLRGAVGYSEAESRNVLLVNFNQMPEYYEFRAGGARSIRGYGWETLFPGDALTGGKHQLIGSIEYEHEIIPDWSAAVFVDGGNAFNDWDDVDTRLGVGIGVRWRSPVGLARVDLGFPLDDAEDAFQVYITVGPEF